MYVAQFSGPKIQVELLAPGQTAKAFDRENLAWEGAVLTACRPTKGGDELKRVVPLNIIQQSKVRALIPLRECY